MSVSTTWWRHTQSTCRVCLYWSKSAAHVIASQVLTANVWGRGGNLQAIYHAVQPARPNGPPRKKVLEGEKEGDRPPPVVGISSSAFCCRPWHLHNVPHRFAPDGREAQTFQGELLPVAAGEAGQRHLSQPAGPCTGWHECDISTVNKLTF